jgi:polyhydroxyalkanoate synthesis regulator phasin
MGKGELLKRSLEKGTSFVDMTRDRAEVLVKELVDAGVVRKGQAEKAIDLVVERSRKRTEALAGLIRREVAEQLSALGVATKDDITRLESKLGHPEADRAGAPSQVKSPSRSPKAAAVTKSAKVAGAPRTSGAPKAPPAMKPATSPRKATRTAATPPKAP